MTWLSRVYTLQTTLLRCYAISFAKRGPTIIFFFISSGQQLTYQYNIESKYILAEPRENLKNLEYASTDLAFTLFTYFLNLKWIDLYLHVYNRSGEIDVIATGLSMQAAPSANVKFSQSFYFTSLGFMVLKDSSHEPSILVQLGLALLTTAPQIIFICFVMAVFFWIFERHGLNDEVYQPGKKILWTSLQSFFSATKANTYIRLHKNMHKNRRFLQVCVPIGVSQIHSGTLC